MIAPDAPTLTAKTDPGPGVEVFFPSLDSLAATIIVWRVADGVTEAVQGAQRATVAGDFVVTDWSVPFGVPSTYVGEIFDAAGASIKGGSSTIQVDSDEVRFSNPIDPSQTFTVELQAPSMQGVERGVNNQRVFVVGVPRPFNQYWGEGALQGIPLEIWSRSGVETENMKSLTHAGQWLIRTPPLFSTLPRLLYVALQPPRHTPIAMWDPDNTVVWTLVVDEVQPISKATLRPLITWDDWTAAFPSPATWDDVMAVYAAGTWTDAIRNPPHA